MLSDLKQLRKSTCRIGKDFASRAHKAASAIEAKDLLADGMSALQELYSGESVSNSFYYNAKTTDNYIYFTIESI